MVGGAIEHCFKHAHELFIHDPAKYDLSDVTNNVDFAYITETHAPPEHGGCDTSIVEEILQSLPEGFTAVIKNTVIQGNH